MLWAPFPEMLPRDAPAEGSGAHAARLHRRDVERGALAGKAVAVICCGGNVAMSTLRELLLACI